MQQEIECCGVSYIVEDSKSTCAFCGSKLKTTKTRSSLGGVQLSGAQRRQLKKAGLVLPKGCVQPQDDLEYMEYLAQESEKFRVLQMKSTHGHLLVKCPCCEQIKKFSGFNWLRGRKPEYDILSDKYREDLVLTYGEIIRDNRLVCAQCVMNYTNNNLPRSEEEQREVNNQKKKQYYYRNRQLIDIPAGGRCPKCKQIRGLGPNSWAKTPSGVICRSCKARSKSRRE